MGIPDAPATLEGMRDVTGSWLSGPTTSADGSEQAFKGQRLGLPEHGEGSIASLGVRAGAILVDWLLAYAIVGVVVTLGGPGMFGAESFAGVSSWAVPLLWGTMGVVCVWFWRSFVRVLFIFFLLPPLIQDEDGRGMHDRATGTALIRTR